MALNLNDPSAIDYGADTPLLPFEEFGDFDLALIDFKEFVSESELDLRRRELKLELKREPTRDELPAVGHNGSCDIATVKVLNSTNANFPEGSVFGLWFDGDATGDSRTRVIARNRAFMSATVGASPKDPKFDANAARAALLGTDLSSGEAHVHLSRRPQQGKGKWEGTTFANDTYRPLD